MKHYLKRSQVTLQAALQEAEQNAKLAPYHAEQRRNALLMGVQTIAPKDARALALLNKRARIHAARTGVQELLDCTRRQVSPYLPYLNDSQIEAYNSIYADLRGAGWSSIQIATRLTLRLINNRARLLRKQARAAKKRAQPPKAKRRSRGSKKQ